MNVRENWRSNQKWTIYWAQNTERRQTKQKHDRETRKMSNMDSTKEKRG